MPHSGMANALELSFSPCCMLLCITQLWLALSQDLANLLITLQQQVTDEANHQESSRLRRVILCILMLEYVHSWAL